ncbi:MAG: hypothetical protein ACXVCR_02745 [Bdellovibrio sp.]
MHSPNSMELVSRDKALSQYMNEPQSLKQAVTVLSAHTIAECRQKEHWLAKVLMLEGNYQGAVAQLTLTMMKYGPHIGLRIDLATCYYLMGLARLYEKTILEAGSDYTQILKLLHPINQAKSSLMMGKLLEECGQTAAAKKIYNESLNFIEMEVFQPTWFYDYSEIFLRLLSQVLRFSVQFEFCEEAHRSFRLLQMSHKKEIKIQDAKDDIAHAVHLYHLRFTHDYDSQSLKSMSEQTRRLCQFETIETMLRFKKDQTALPNDINSTDSYERSLIHLYKRSFAELNTFLVMTLPELSKASLIRIVMLAQHIKPGAISAEIVSLFNAVMLDLSEQDKLLWRRWLPSTNSKQVKLILDKDTLIVKNESEIYRIDLKKRKMIKKFLECFCKKDQWPWEEIVELLWQQKPDLLSYDRLRMLVSRTNNLVSTTERIIDFKDHKLIAKNKIFAEEAT